MNFKKRCLPVEPEDEGYPWLRLSKVAFPTAALHGHQARFKKPVVNPKAEYIFYIKQ